MNRAALLQYLTAPLRGFAPNIYVHVAGVVLPLAALRVLVVAVDGDAEMANRDAGGGVLQLRVPGEAPRQKNGILFGEANLGHDLDLRGGGSGRSGGDA